MYFLTMKTVTNFNKLQVLVIFNNSFIVFTVINSQVVAKKEKKNTG
jgi:hypothetical protein